MKTNNRYRKKSKVNATGRSENPGGYFKFQRIWLRSDAYQSLDVYARALLIAFLNRYYVHNNGDIHMSVREAANALGGNNKQIAQRSLRMLQDHGWIVTTQVGSFHWKTNGPRQGRRATTFRLTMFPFDNNPPTNEWQNWRSPK